MNNIDTAQNELLSYMMKLSQIAFFSTWDDNLEYLLWAVKNNETDNLGLLNVNDDIIKNLNTLCNNCNGWFYWDHDINNPKFISLSDWNVFVEKRVQKLKEGSQ